MNDQIIKTIEYYGFFETKQKNLYHNEKSGKSFYLGTTMDMTCPQELIGHMPFVKILSLNEDITAEMLLSYEPELKDNEWLIVYDKDDEYEFFMKDLWNFCVQL